MAPTHSDDLLRTITTEFLVQNDRPVIALKRNRISPKVLDHVQDQCDTVIAKVEAILDGDDRFRESLRREILYLEVLVGRQHGFAVLTKIIVSMVVFMVSIALAVMAFPDALPAGWINVVLLPTLACAGLYLFFSHHSTTIHEHAQGARELIQIYQHCSWRAESSRPRARARSTAD